MEFGEALARTSRKPRSYVRHSVNAWEICVCERKDKDVNFHTSADRWVCTIISIMQLFC